VVEPEEVTLAYQLFLGREPESHDVVNNLCQTAQTVQHLRNIFLKSPEFVKQMSELLDKPQEIRHRHPYHLPKIPVQTEVTQEELQQMFERIHKEWEHLGATEPYWSVVTQPHYYLSEFDAHKEQFYASGKHSSEIFLAALRRCGINPSELSTCLEVGCGVGRVTGYLAKAFEKVIAADISSQHLALAKTYLEGQGLQKVQLVHWHRLAQLSDLQNLDAIYSLITLQHNPPPVMVWILRQLLSHLRTGGVAYFQLPTYRNGYMFEAERYLQSKAINTLEMHFLPQLVVFEVVADAGCKVLEVREDGMVGDENLMLSNTFLVQKR